MKKIAVITGASSGMGRRFAETVDTFDRFDEVWVIARHEKALAMEADRLTGEPRDERETRRMPFMTSGCGTARRR